MAVIAPKCTIHLIRCRRLMFRYAGGMCSEYNGEILVGSRLSILNLSLSLSHCLCCCCCTYYIPYYVLFSGAGFFYDGSRLHFGTCLLLLLQDYLELAFFPVAELLLYVAISFDVMVKIFPPPSLKLFLSFSLSFFFAHIDLVALLLVVLRFVQLWLHLTTLSALISSTASLDLVQISGSDLLSSGGDGLLLYNSGLPLLITSP
ncbi:hypothetical protein PS15m_005532 [Mucor circinelloides]